MKKLAIVSLFLAASVSLHAQAEAPFMTQQQALELGRKYVTQFYNNEVTEIWSHMSPDMRHALGSEASLREISAKLQKDLGKETGVLNERVLPSLKFKIYTRLVSFTTVPEMVVQFTFAPDGEIAGFFFTPSRKPAETKFLDYKPKVVLTLPFYGYWTVYQGGRSVYDNYHALSSDERFAYDFIVIRADRQFEGDGEKVEDFFSFGRPVLAPGAGTVVAAVDQYEDNVLNKLIPGIPKPGNNIVIDHGNNEFSMIAHLKRGSLRVKTGDVVEPSQEIALTGNSGNSPIPHLHYHLQNTAEWFKGDGLPIVFTNFKSNGKPVTSGEPVKGDLVSGTESGKGSSKPGPPSKKDKKK